MNRRRLALAFVEGLANGWALGGALALIPWALSEGAWLVAAGAALCAVGLARHLREKGWLP